jgi:hypothetical protein
MQSRTGLTGNCWSACAASLLEIPLHAVPEFPQDDEEWLEAVQRWLMPLGMFYLEIPADDPMLEFVFRCGFTWHFMVGISERGGPHACVGFCGQLNHDPHPGGRGLEKLEKYGFLVSRMMSGAPMQYGGEGTSCMPPSYR